MASEATKETELELAHVLFIDIVGFSKHLINEQRALLDTLNTIVRNTNACRTEDATGKLRKIPTSDGLALVFYTSKKEPVQCALEIARANIEHTELELRMGVHTGLVSGVVDVNESANVAGAAINMAQRIMDCGDGGHILLSKRVAEDLEPIVEVTQIKGDGDTHPYLSPNDEFANFERWDRGNLDLSADRKPEMLQFEYARSALKTGLKLEKECEFYFLLFCLSFQTNKVVIMRYQTFIGAVLALTLISGCGHGTPSTTQQVIRPVRTMRVGVSQESGGRAFPGQAEANEEAELSFRIGGSLIELLANVGDTVKKGQVLANLDPTDFQVRLRDAEVELSSAEANLEVANVMLTRSKNLFEQRAGPKMEVDRAAAQVESAKANIAALRTKRDIAQSELNYAVLTAPFDGIIAARYAQNFQTVLTKQPILRLLETSRIKFGVDLPETAMPLLPYAKEIWVTFQAVPGNKLPATIQEVSYEASPSTRTYRLTVLVDQPAGARILPGMSGELRARLEPPSTQPNAMEVLASALFEGTGGATYVWLVDTSTMTVHRQQVKTLRPGTVGFLVEGLKPGQTIVTAGVHYLKEAQKVRVMESPAEIAEPAGLTNDVASEKGQ
jgi:RND family efflux transporter MFP subunit